MTDIAENLKRVKERIAAAAADAGRSPSAIQLVAVSKTFDAASVWQAIAAGHYAFGENYVQEAVDKIAAVHAMQEASHLRQRIEWHFIGPIQSNKTRQIAAGFDWVHSVDRLKVAQRLSEQRPADLPPLDVLLQVNISGEASKSGVAPGEVEGLAREMAGLPRLRLRGLMAIPEPAADPEGQRAPLAAMRTLFDRLRAQGPAIDTLSMGMSADLEAAVLEGSTMVRIGTAIFGERERKHA